MKRPTVIGLALVLALAIVGYYYMTQLKERFSRGETKVGLRRAITQDLLDSSATGLERFKAVHHRYPQSVGKYFLDSIKTLVQFKDVYVYADSIDNEDRSIPLGKTMGKKFDYINFPHTYLGAGSPGMTIVYRAQSMNSYILYSVGENHLDENGGGDDITR